MKKIAIIALSLSALNAFAWEVQVKGGYDFYRGRSKEIKIESNKLTSTHNLSESGFTLGLEIIPFNKSVVEFGLGTEYNFATTKALYTKTQNTHDDNNQGYTLPVYALVKANMLRDIQNTKALYTFGRLGYAFSADKAEKKFPENSGLYFGAGLGFEIKHFVFEGLYDAIYHYSKVGNGQVVNNASPQNGKTHNIDHKAGIRVGFRFGDFAKKPAIIVAPIIPVVKPEMPKPEPKEPKVYKTYGKLINASCDEVAKECVIHGFKVDGRMPNDEEQQNIVEIAALINDFAGTGYADIIGHTDSTGSDAYNDKLSVARAQSVTKLLQEAGLTDGIKILSISGKGEKEPMATNATKEGRYLNRRVEIKFSDLVLEKTIVE